MVLRPPRPLWKKGLKDEMIGSFVEDKLIALGKNYTANLSTFFSFFFFFIDRSIYVLWGAPGNVQTLRSLEMLKGVFSKLCVGV